MKRIALATALCLSFLVQAFPQDKFDDDMLTNGYPNGRLWETFSESHRTIMLVGIQNGILLVLNQSVGTPQEEATKVVVSKMLITKLRPSEITEQINAFYRDKANLAIPISLAYMVSVLKANGASPKELEEYSALLRKQLKK